jgi:hypothetical protein
MSQNIPPVMTPQQPYAAYPPPKRTNGLAIASLICGIVGCVPLITSLAAVLLGILGLRKTKDPTVGGKGLAIAGLVLGLVGLAGWSLFGGGMYLAYNASKPARSVANQFAVDLSTGNLTAAAAATTGMATPELAAVAEQIKPWGTVTSTTFSSFNVSSNSGSPTTCHLTGVAIFSTAGAKTYDVQLIDQNGTYKVQSFDFK